MKNLILLITCLTLVSATWANKIEAKLIGESQDGRTVKLMWFVKKWDKNLIGFNIKRKGANNEWVTINNDLIVPEVSVDKNLQIVENSTEELLRLKSKLKTMLDAGQLKSADRLSFVNSLITNSDTLKVMSRSFGQDFDLALFSGFGFSDRAGANQTEEYALFPVRVNQVEDKFPSATFIWKNEDKANVNPSINISTANTDNGVQLVWKMPLETINKIHAKGFNIYRKEGNAWVKVNDKPIQEFDNNKNGYTFFDNNIGKNEVTYSVTLTTMFNNESNVNENTIVYKHPISSDIASNN
ncbi:MAG: hypothetical protein WCP65_01425 [Bacteroidota bacterium]